MKRTWLLSFLFLACNAGGDLLVEERHATASDALRANALERGLVPSWLPQGAFDLRIVADLDDGLVALEFSTPAEFDLAEHLDTVGAAARSRLREDSVLLRGRILPESWPRCVREPDESCPGYRYLVLEGEAPTRVVEDVGGGRVYWLTKKP